MSERHVSTYSVILKPSKKTDPRVVSFSALWDPQCPQLSITEAKVQACIN